ncbi:uncharacterized protein [Amphiura filiformis]|uniref:uncharacterized protein n=1 Tax=Amphiura filiformis TaxID=82378 RepID=UPI003B216919
MLQNCLPRRMSLRLIAPYMIIFLVAFVIALGLWGLVFRQQEEDIDWISDFHKKGKPVKVADVGKDLQSKLNYVHAANSKIHRARNLAIDKMIEIQQQKLEVEKAAREHSQRADQKDAELQQERKRYLELKKSIDHFKSEIMRMQELQKLMDEERAANEAVKKKLKEENESLKKQLESLRGIR